MSDVQSSSSSDDDDDPGNPRATSPSSSSSDDGRDWLDYHHSSDDEHEEELDVLGAAAPVVTVKKETRQLYTSKITGLDQHVQRMLQSCDQPHTDLVPTSNTQLVPTSNTQLVPTSSSQEAGDALSVAKGSSSRGGPNTTLVQLNVTQQQFGDVTVEKATHINQNFGGSQNISKTATIYEGQKGKELSRADTIMERTISHFKAWNKGMVKTAALGQVLEKLNSGTSWLTIKGDPGEGKTTVGYMALEELHKCGRQVFEVRSPDEFTEVISTCSRPIIMLDDVFGNLEFDKTKWSNWEPVVSPLLKEREHKSHEEVDKTSKKDVTVILIGRDYVLNPASVDLGRLSVFLTSDKHVVYMDHSVKRRIEEKRAIWESISSSSGVELDQTIVDKILKIEVPHGFPHVCHLFTTIFKENKAIDVVKFFSKPLEFLNASTSNLFKDTNKLMFFREMVKAEGKISKRELRKLDPTLKITQAADSLVGTYMKVEEDCFVFDHPSIYDSVAFHMCSLDPEFVIQQCQVSFIHERVRILFSQDVNSINNSESSLVVYVNRSYADDLAERLASEIRAKNLHVLSHQAFTDKTFVSKVVSRIKTSLQSLIHLDDRYHYTYDYSFPSLIPSSKSPELLKYIDNCPDITLSTEDEKQILYGTCRYAASEVLTYLINTRQSLNINVIYSYGKTPLMIAAETGNVHFVHQILSLSPDLNARDDMDKTISHYLSHYGLVSAMTQVIDSGIDINVQDRSKKSPLSDACRYNQLAVVKLLIERGARVDKISLHKACIGGNIHIVELLIEKGARVGETSLHKACIGGNIHIVELLIEKGARVDQTSLYTAFAGGNIHIVELLIERGARVDETSLYGACIGGNIHIVELLIEKGARVYETSLHAACRGGNIHIVELLIEKGARVYETSLYEACIGGKIHIVELLIEKGARVYETSLYEACRGGNIHIVELLIEKGARVDETSLHAACRGGNIHIVELLIEKGARVYETSLHAACRGGNIHIVELMIEKGARVDETSLNKACRGGNIHIVELLFKTDKNLSTKDILNSSLSAASEGGNVDIMNLLVNKGASVNQSDSRLFPLQAACRYQQPQAVNWLLQQGADVDSRDIEGATALYRAAGRVSGECVEILLKTGATVNIQNKEGNTALHTAAYWGDGKCVEILLKAGATVDIQNKEGDTPLHSAARHWLYYQPDISTCQTLIQQGAGVNTQNNVGNTPLHCLCASYTFNVLADWEVYKDVALMLIDRGADVDILNKQGQPALHGQLHRELQEMKLSEKREKM